MTISRNLLSEFVKITNDNEKPNNVSNIYGTISTNNGVRCVTIDGSTIKTPVKTTTDIKDGERVMLTIDNHMAIVTGNISNPSAGNDRVESAESSIGKFDHLFAGNITADNIQAGAITADKILAGTITADKLEAGTITAGSGVIADGAIGNAQINNLDAAKITSGTIDTSDVTIAGADGVLRIKGNRMQVFNGMGVDQFERVSVGDVNGDGTVYGLRVRGADGETILIDENGVTEEGITDGSISNDKINPNAGIEGGKLDIDSVMETINKDGTKTINSVRIDVDSKNLSVVINEINDKSTELNTNIQTNTANIKANSDSIKMKVDEQKYTTDITNMTTQMNKNTSSIDVMKNELSLKVEQSDITTAINNINVGGRNLVANSMPINTYGWKNSTGWSISLIDEINAPNGKCICCTNDSSTVTGGMHKSPIDQSRDLVDGEEYTVSAYIKASKNCKVRFSNEKMHNSSTYTDITTSWKKYTFTGKIDINKQYYSNTFYVNGSDTVIGMQLYVHSLKLEKGNTATSWSPASEDIANETDTKISTAKSEIKLTTDSITSKVEKVETTSSNHETRIQNAEVKLEPDKITQVVTSSTQWLGASGGVNHIPNPTALINMDGWGAPTGGIIKRYEKDAPFKNPELHVLESYGGGLSLLLIDCNDKIIFVDGGYEQNAQHCIDYMKNLGINKIDYYIITHCHSDHIESTPTIMNAFDVYNVIIKELLVDKLPPIELEWDTHTLYYNVLQVCTSNGIPILDPKMHNYIKLSSDSNIKIFNSNSTNYENYNHQSLMILYEFKGRKIFLAGDGTHYASEAAINQVGTVDIFQAGHHGDGTIGGTSQKLIDELKPRHTIFASAFLAVDSAEVNAIETLKRVSFWGGVSYSHGPGHNNDYILRMDDTGVIAVSGLSTRANNVWFERYPEMWYWFKSNGLLAKNESLTIDGKIYHFNVDGVCTNP